MKSQHKTEDDDDHIRPYWATLAKKTPNCSFWRSWTIEISNSTTEDRSYPPLAPPPQQQKKLLDSCKLQVLAEFEAYFLRRQLYKLPKPNFICRFGANLAKSTKLLKQLQGFLSRERCPSILADTVQPSRSRHRLIIAKSVAKTTVVILQTEAFLPGTSAEKKKEGRTHQV
jgi:hypothetical protein